MANIQVTSPLLKIHSSARAQIPEKDGPGILKPNLVGWGIVHALWKDVGSKLNF